MPFKYVVNDASSFFEFTLSVNGHAPSSLWSKLLIAIKSKATLDQALLKQG